MKTGLPTEALFAEAKLKPEKFQCPDVVLAKRRDMPAGDHAAQIKIDLASIFSEADADHDGKLTFEEWHNRCGKWFDEGELRMLFTACDTNGDGVLDIEEFTKGCENKYLIKWAQVIRVHAVDECVVLMREEWARGWHP